MSFTTIRLEATIDNPTGAPMDGTITATLTAAMQDTSTGEVIEPFPIQGLVNAEGVLTFDNETGIPLAANDDPTTDPTGVQYTIQEEITGVPMRTYQITVPHTAAGGVLQLSTVAP